jgi:hypothetical protein
MYDAIKPQRKQLAKVMGHIVQLRLKRAGVVLPEAPATAADAKLDAILKELAALRKEVQELKQKK